MFKILNPFKKNIQVKASRQSNFKLSDFLSYMQTKGWHKVTATLAMQMYDKNSALADSVDTIIESAKSIKPLIKKNNDFIDKNEILDLFKNPNPLMSYGEFIEAALMYKLLTGNVFITAIGNTRYVPLELWVTPTDTIVIQGNGLNFSTRVFAQNAIDFLNKEYIYDAKLKRSLSGNLAEMIHIKRFINYSMTDGYVANSVLNSIIYELEILNNGNNHNLAMLLNGVNLNGVFNVDTTDAKVVEQFKIDVANYFSGSANAGKHLVSQGKTIDFRPIQMTNKDMEALGNAESVRKVIYDRFQIPSPLRSLGTETYSNYEAAQYVLYDKAIIPVINTIFDGLTNAFQVRGILKPDETISYDPKSIPALQSRFFAELKTKKEINIYTTNELRNLAGDELLGAEHDVIYQQMNLVPVGSSIPQADQQVTNEAKKRLALILKNAGYSDEQITERVNKYYVDNN